MAGLERVGGVRRWTVVVGRSAWETHDGSERHRCPGRKITTLLNEPRSIPRMALLLDVCFIKDYMRRSRAILPGRFTLFTGQVGWRGLVDDYARVWLGAWNGAWVSTQNTRGHKRGQRRSDYTKPALPNSRI